MKSIFAQYGVISSEPIVKTSTPTIGILACVVIDSVAYVVFDVTNNDGSTADIDVSYSPDFTSSSSLSVASLADGSFQLVASGDPPGSTTVYARATATGFPVSNTRVKTQTISGCFAEP
jgi:hypothetical protein